MKKTIFTLALLLQTSVLSSASFADDVIGVEINKGRMVKFPKAAASVVVADPTTADIQVVSPKAVYVYGKKVGETSLSAIDDNDDPIFDAVIDVSHNLSSLKRTVKRSAPNADVDFRTVDGGLVLTGSASSIQEAENINKIASSFVAQSDKVVNMVTTAGGDQVMLQVRIVEMARTDLKNLGINLSGSLTGGGIVTQVLNGPLSATVPNPARGASTNLLSTLTGGSGSISGLIEALENDGLATVLAEPSLTTVTGKPASFLAGGQYPIPVAGENGTVTVQYQPFGVSLNFTPVVMNKNRMSIFVNPEVSTLNFSNPIQVAGFTYPILDTRKAQATVELGSGQTFVLAGLLRNDGSNNINKMPGVGDLPVLGALFRSQKFISNQTELVILVTPYIVHPVSDKKKIQTPLDGLEVPTDMQRTVLGSLYQQQDMDDSPKAKEVVLDGDDTEKSDDVSDNAMIENVTSKETPKIAAPAAKKAKPLAVAIPAPVAKKSDAHDSVAEKVELDGAVQDSSSADLKEKINAEIKENEKEIQKPSSKPVAKPTAKNETIEQKISETKPVKHAAVNAKLNGETGFILE